VTYRPVYVLFCSQNGAWARFDPMGPTLSVAFAPLQFAPSASAQWTSSGNFVWTKVDWVEVHGNNAASTGTATMWIDDFRVMPQ
jgi:hypothetical protein